MLCLFDFSVFLGGYVFAAAASVVVLFLCFVLSCVCLLVVVVRCSVV